MDTLFSDAMLTHSLFMFLMLGSVAGLFAGAALLLRPGWLLHASKLVNRWISTRKWTRVLARSIALDAWFYRYNKYCGAILLTGSIYIVYFFIAVFDKTRSLDGVFKIEAIPRVLMGGLIDGLVLIALTGAVFVAMISLFLMLRPSLLREFEFHANKKASLRKGLRPLEMHHDNLDQYVFRHQRLAGALILAGSIYTLLILVNNWKIIL
jgi:hypothetical protein